MQLSLTISSAPASFPTSRPGGEEFRVLNVNVCATDTISTWVPRVKRETGEKSMWLPSSVYKYCESPCDGFSTAGRNTHTGSWTGERGCLYVYGGICGFFTTLILSGYLISPDDAWGVSENPPQGQIIDHNLPKSTSSCAVQHKVFIDIFVLIYWNCVLIHYVSNSR